MLLPTHNIAYLPGTSQSAPHSNQDLEHVSEDALDNPDIGQTDLDSELLFEEDPEQDTTIFSINNSDNSTNCAKPPRKRKCVTGTNTDKVIQYLEGKVRKEIDDTEQIMLGYAKTIKKLSRKRQIIAKRRIAQIVLDLELEEVEECSMLPSPSPQLSALSFSTDN